MADPTNTPKRHKNARDDLTAEFVRSVLDYDPETGVFIRKWRADVPKHTNTRYAGKPTGCPNSKAGHLVIRINGTLYLAHRLAWLFMTGAWPSMEIDHIDGRASNNAWTNLREATSQENLRNQGKKPNNTSGYKGVSFFKRDGTWRAQIRYGGTSHSIGYFKTKEEAAEAYRREAAKYHLSFAKY